MRTQLATRDDESTTRINAKNAKAQRAQRKPFQKNEGDEISLLLSLDRDAYVLLIYSDAAGRLTRLLPLPGKTGQRMTAGAFVPFPDKRAGLRLTVTPPFGREAAWFFAAGTPFPLAEIDALSATAGNFDALLRRIRRHGSGTTYGEARLLIDTEAARGLSRPPFAGRTE